MYINVIFQTISFYITQASRSFTFLFMYLGELLQYYQSRNNLPQSFQTLDFDLKSCFVLLNNSSRSTRCWLASVSLFVVLVCLGPRVALLIVDLCPSQSLLVWFGLLRTLSRSARCSLVSVNLSFFVLPCYSVDLLVVDLSWQSRQSVSTFVLCVQTSTRSACCSVVSGGYLNTLTFVGLVLVNSCFIDPSFSVFDLFLIALNSVSVWLLSVLLLYCFPQTFTQCPTSARRRKKDRVPLYMYI